MQQAIDKTVLSDTSPGEVIFGAEKLLASATDDRGIIRYANSEFCEVAGYSRDELVGAPHKIVRHPDMPRGIFHLMWARLKSGKPVCVYVKNQCTDGRFYWVLATISSMADGYMSIRIKPSDQEFFEKTQSLYTTLLQKESEGASAEKSAALFVELLQENGFESFEAYAQAALGREVAARDDVRNQAGSRRKTIEQLSELMEKAEALVGDITSIFNQVRGEPINLRILSGRLEDAGVAIGTISKNYETMATDMYQMIDGLRCAQTGTLVRMREALTNAFCSSQIAALADLTEDQMTRKHGMASRTIEGRDLLIRQARHLKDTSTAALSDVNTLGKLIPDICRQLRRRINGLDLVKLLCRVESGRMSDVDSGLTGIISRLEEAHHKADRHLAALSAIAFQIDATAKTL